MPYKNEITGIYCIRNIVNSKRYIGQSVNIFERWASHRAKLRSGNHGNQYLQSAWSKYGEQCFEFSILKECSDDELNFYEEHYMALFDTLNHNKGYNIEPSGVGESHRSPETIQRMVANRKYGMSDEQRRKISEAQKGRKLTPQWKANISKAHKAAIQNGTMQVNVQNLFQHNEKTSKKIICCTADGATIGEFDSIQKAGRVLNLPATNICKVLKGKYKHCGGYMFSYI